MDRRVEHHPRAAGFQKIGAGYLPEIGPDTGYNNLTLLLGLIALVVLVIVTLRKRRQQARIGADLSPCG
ncbi:LPXTG cell wall anchor domain-containing protein [Tessaracoccus coleopterorum]|uniref:LPXTG cell wall anchor domain-containing protein n=1 Tax=Tessaracoccus coleopterorum TaxID=2714950 RepID=UPI0018D4D488|nr:LPXTG cell wall anchor domain-containing protein [Tessaracoccus coleopterorum]